MNLLNEEGKNAPAMPVSEFLHAARRAIEGALPELWVEGEVTGFKSYPSGHWYFGLRDSEAQVRCVMFRQDNAHITGTPQDGDAVRVRAKPDIYVQRGSFQLTVRDLQLAGAGRLYQIFAERHREWKTRGWFDDDKKKMPPEWPETVGVVASDQGAALRDVLRTLKTRMPSIRVVVYPAPAQGKDAAPKIADAIAVANQRRECDVLLVVRGGGGIEDLWAYNEEPAVAAIVDSALPVITGIGHEVDRTLADFAADRSGPTPTAAAALASPDAAVLRRRLREAAGALRRATRRHLNERSQQIDWARDRIPRPSLFVDRKLEMLKHHAMRLSRAPAHVIETLAGQLGAARARLRPPSLSELQARLQRAADKVRVAARTKNNSFRYRLDRAKTSLEACNPQRTLARGYSIVRDASGKAVRDASSLRPGNSLGLTFASGFAEAEVKQVRAGGNPRPPPGGGDE